jgi:hypothetical protein
MSFKMPALRKSDPIQARQSLVDGDAARLELLRLGNHNRQDAVFQTGRDGVLVDAGGKVKGAREVSEATLREPVLGLVGVCGGLLLFGLLLDGAICRVLGALVLDCGLERGSAATLLNGCGTRLRGAGSVVALGSAADRQGLRLGELDLEVLLGKTGKLSVQLIGIGGFADVKPRLPVGDVRAAARGVVGAGVFSTRVLVKVLEETEEGAEGGVVVVDGAREECHFEVL